jgi:hypothetical protein
MPRSWPGLEQTCASGHDPCGGVGHDVDPDDTESRAAVSQLSVISIVSGARPARGAHRRSQQAWAPQRSQIPAPLGASVTADIPRGHSRHVIHLAFAHHSASVAIASDGPTRRPPGPPPLAGGVAPWRRAEPGDGQPPVAREDGHRLRQRLASADFFDSCPREAGGRPPHDSLRQSFTE